MLEGLIAFTLLAAAAIAGEILLIDRLRISPVNDWLADHIYLPMLRLPALIGFVLASYPALYGLESAPPLATLLDFDWFGRALNLLFILPLLLSLAPVAGQISSLVLPLQGIALTALLFTPLTTALAIDSPSYWPDRSAWLALAVFGVGGHLLGSAVARRLPGRRLAVPLHDAVVLFCQAPAIMAYGHALGARV
jgi:hypothetical protein